MSKRITRDTVSGRAYLDLQNLARRTGRNTDELLRAFVFERFLYRVALSDYQRQLVLKGGMLLAALDVRRPTVDIDLLAQRMPNNTEVSVTVVRDILGAQQVDDGVWFDADRIAARTIREGDVYSGVRLELPAGLATARIKLKLDINFGDPTVPAPALRPFPCLLDNTDGFEVLCYAIETVLAEKIETMIRRGDANTRWRDFADVLLLIRRHEVAANDLESALRATCTHRGTPWMPLAEAIQTLPEAGQRSWQVFCEQRGISGLPRDFSQAIAEIGAFVDPLVAGDVGGCRWGPNRNKWHR